MSENEWINLVLGVLLAAVPLAEAVTRLTKTPEDDKWVTRVGGWVRTLGGLYSVSTLRGNVKNWLKNK